MFWQQKIKVLDLNPGKMQWKIVCELKGRLGVSARNKRNPKRNGKKKLLKLRRACGLSNLPWLLATSSYMYQEVLLQPVQAAINLKSKLAPRWTWTMVCHVKLLDNFLQIMVLQELSSRESLGTY